MALLLLGWTGLEVVEQAGADAGGLTVVEADVGVGGGVGRGKGGGEILDAEQTVPEEGTVDGKLVCIGALAEDGIRLVIVALAGIDVADDGPLGATLGVGQLQTRVLKLSALPSSLACL